MAYIEMNGNMRILLVDSDVINAQAMKQYLKKIGYVNAIHCPSSYDAMHLIRDAKADFIMSRMSLPSLRGPDLFEEMLNDFSISRLPFAIFEDRMSGDDVALLKELGVDGTLSLPFVQKDLAELLSRTWARYVDKTNPEYLFEQARRLFFNKRNAEAEKVFQSLLERGHHPERALIGLARIAKSNNDLESARSFASQVVQRFPEYVHGFQMLGEIEAASGKNVEAITAFTRAIQISPKNPYRYWVVGGMLNAIGMWEDAEKLYRKAMEIGIDFPDLKAGLASALANLGKRKDAIKIYEELITKYPKQSTFLNNAAACYKNDGDHNKATECYRKALELDPKNSRVMFNLALLIHVQGNPDAAKKLLRSAIQIDPKYDKAQRKLDEWEGRVSVAKEVKIGAEESVTAPKTLKADELAQLKKLMGAAHGGLLASQGTAVEISEAERAVIVKAPLESMAAAYQGLCFRTRRVFGLIIGGYSEMISAQSSEIVSMLLEVTSKAEEFNKSGAMSESVSIVMTTLQFQDRMTQLLNGYAKAFVSLTDKGNKASAADFQAAVKTFPVVESREKFEKVASEISKHARSSFQIMGFLPIETLEFCGLELLNDLEKDLRLGDAELSKAVSGYQTMGADEEILNTLKGISQHLLTLAKRIHSLRSMLEMGVGTLLHADNDQTARQVLLIFGKDMRGLWPRMEALCETPEERTLVVESEKKVALAMKAAAERAAAAKAAAAAAGAAKPAGKA